MVPEMAYMASVLEFCKDRSSGLVGELRLVILQVQVSLLPASTCLSCKGAGPASARSF